MSDVTQILSQIESGDRKAGEQLLPLVYDELRKLAAAKLAQEKPGQTLAAAAESMRRILVENARRKQRIRHGGQYRRVELDELLLCVENPVEDVLAISEVLDRLAQVDERSAEFVKLRYFVGLSVDEAAEALGISPRTAHREWAYARAWLHVARKRLPTPPGCTSS